MQQYFEIAAKNGVALLETGACQFCGAATTRGVHECVEIFGTGFDAIDFSNSANHYYRFLAVDAHTLQHPEIHGRWNNHFHLTRQHLMYRYKTDWNYGLSPRLSDYLKEYKTHNSTEYLEPPMALERGAITTTDVLNNSSTERECQEIIVRWGQAVYTAWENHHPKIDEVAQGFLERNRGWLPIR